MKFNDGRAGLVPQGWDIPQATSSDRNAKLTSDFWQSFSSKKIEYEYPYFHTLKYMGAVEAHESDSHSLFAPPFPRVYIINVSMRFDDL